jgi:hypothetical protein
MVRVDQRYIDGVDFSRPSKNLSSVFKIGKQNISDLSEKGSDYLDRMHDINYTGYTHEFVTDQWARSRGEEVIVPEKFNQKGFDRIYNGEKYQIKFGNIGEVREHRLENPTIKVRSDIETAEKYKEKFPEDAAMVFGTTPKGLTESLVSGGKEGTMEVFENEELFDSNVPEIFGIASIISVFRNVTYFGENKTDLATGAQNVAIDVAGRGAAMWAGGAIGSFLGPIGTAAGVIGGAILGKDIIDGIKVHFFCEEEKNQLEKDLDLYILATKKILKRNQETFEKKMGKLKTTLGSKIYRKKVLKETKMTEELYEFLIKRMLKEYNEKKETLGKFEMAAPSGEDWKKYDVPKKYREYRDTLEAIGEKSEDGAIPAQRYLNYKKFEDYSDIKLPEIAAEAEKLSAKVGISREFLQKETEQLVKSIEVYVKALQKRGV